MKKDKLLPNFRFMLRQRILYHDRVFPDLVSRHSFLCCNMALRSSTRPGLAHVMGVRMRMGHARDRAGPVSQHGFLCRDRVFGLPGLRHRFSLSIQGSLALFCDNSFVSRQDLGQAESSCVATENFLSQRGWVTRGPHVAT